MSRLQRTQLEHLAQLARLELDPSEIPPLLEQLEGVLALFETLGEIDLEAPQNAAPKKAAPKKAPRDGCPLRADEISPPRRDDLFAAAPRRDAEGRLLVPPMLRATRDS